MKKLFASFIIILAVAGTGAILFSQNETMDLASTEEAPPSARSFVTFKMNPFPITADKFPDLKNSEDVASYIFPFHERATQSWNPSYSVFTPGFDSKNRPYFRQNDRTQTVPLTNGFQTFNEGKLATSTIPVEILKSIYPEASTDKILQSTQDILWDPKLAVFDKNDQMYSVLRMRKNISTSASYVLLSSKNFGKTWSALPIVGTTTTQCLFKNLQTKECQTPELYDLERPYSKEPLPGPPALLHYVSSGTLPGYTKTYSWLGTYGRLYLQPVIETPTGLHAETPILISDLAQEIGYRSGGAPKIIHSGEKYFVTWLEATTSYVPKKDQKGQPIVLAPDSSENPYSSIWVAEYNTRTKILAKQELLKSWPVNDTHNQPGIVRASDGSLHVIAGGHGSHFTHSYSLKPDSISEWSKPVAINTKDTGYTSRYSNPNWIGGSQTYVSMMIDSKNQIHTLYRQWQHDKSIFDFDYFGALVYQKGSYDAEHKSFVWNEARVLIYPNASEYTHWYQLMAMDRKDHLYVEYSDSRQTIPYFFKTPEGNSISISPMLNNALIRSDDEGKTWFFPSDNDLIKSIDN